MTEETRRELAGMIRKLCIELEPAFRVRTLEETMAMLDKYDTPSIVWLAVSAYELGKKDGRSEKKDSE